MAVPFKTIHLVHTFRSYFNFFQDQCPNFTPFKTIFGTSFKTITFSLFLAQWWQVSSCSNHLSLTGTQKISRHHSRNGRDISHLCWKHPTFPQERWYANIVGFLGQEGFQCWQHLDISKDPDLKKIPENVSKAIANTLEVLTSYWNHIDEMYSNIRQGEQETTDQLDQCIKVLVKKLWLLIRGREEKMPTGDNLPCNKTLSRSRSGSDCRQHRTKQSHSTNCYCTCQTAWGNH